MVNLDIFEEAGGEAVAILGVLEDCDEDCMGLQVHTALLRTIMCRKSFFMRLLFLGSSDLETLGVG